MALPLYLAREYSPILRHYYSLDRPSRRQFLAKLLADFVTQWPFANKDLVELCKENVINVEIELRDALRHLDYLILDMLAESLVTADLMTARHVDLVDKLHKRSVRCSLAKHDVVKRRNEAATSAYEQGITDKQGLYDHMMSDGGHRELMRVGKGRNRYVKLGTMWRSLTAYRKAKKRSSK